jgi:TP901-1 family phage major tail protein
MAAQKGSAVLIKIAVSGSQTTVGGLRSSTITFNEETVDATNKDSAGARILIPAAGVQSTTIAGSGVFTDTAAEGAMRTAFGGAALLACSFIVPDLGTYSGNFQITTLSYAGEYNGEATYDMTFESGSAVTFAAA